MGARDLHIINARLPLAGSADAWYELKAEAGIWTSITAHPERISVSGAKRMMDLDELHQGAVVDADGRMAVPGFVDMHMHLDKALSLPKVGNRSGTLLEAIVNYGSQAGSFTKAEIRERIVETALMGLRHGTIYMRTHLDMAVTLGRDVLFRTVEAALEAREQLQGRVRLQLFPMLSFDRSPDATADLAKELIALGMDGIGGCPHLANNPEQDVRLLFKTATMLNVPIDLHTDEQDDPSVRTIVPISRLTAAYGYQHRVVAGHLCTLSSMPAAEAGRIMEEMAEAGVGAVSLPAANLYLQGRGDDGPIRRGVTRVRELLEAGVQTAVASDNIRDPFHPFGKGDLVQIALLTAYAAHMGAPEDGRQLLRMISQAPAALMGLGSYGFQPGTPADLVIVDAGSAQSLLQEQSPSRWVAVDGRWVSVSCLVTRSTAGEVLKA